MKPRRLSPLFALAPALVVGASLLIGTARAEGAIPFTTYQAEKQEIMAKLPCKWVSMDGRDGVRRDDAKYDFLCKGGNWATVSLMMDDAQGLRDGVGTVRLLFREWPAAVHPGGGEAYVAQQFLQHVVDHFVPADMAPAVLEGFWQNRKKSWKAKQLRIAFTTEDFGNHMVRRLEIDGLARSLDSGVGAVAVVEPEPAKAEAQAQSGGLLDDAKAAWKGLIDGDAQQQAAPVQQVAQPSPTELLRFSGSPAPESLVSDSAPPPVPAALVPSAEARVGGRASAPQDFEAYNKAEELTKMFEVKSISDPNAGAKVSAPVSSTVGEATGLLVAPSSTAIAPALPAVPTPGVTQPLPVVVSGTVITPTDAGLAKPGTQPSAVQPDVRPDNAVMVPAEDPRFMPDRAMPQLKYIPKAKPVEAPNKVIEFEDEKSAL